MKKREVWLDVLRILAAFLVVVNHTNRTYQAVDPTQGTWWASIIWYAVCKVAVPVFVMISGACLLGREDSYRKCFGRFLRIVGALAVFSYFYFLHDAWVNYGLWPRMIRLDVLLEQIWTQQISDAFWYLYFYAGLMLMLPLLQRLSCAMKERDLGYLTAMCLLFGSLSPMVGKLVPALAPPAYADPAMFSAMIGLFFLGWQIRQSAVPARSTQLLSALVLAASTALSVCLLYVNFAPDTKYWAFMDDRLRPSLPVIAAAASLMVLCRGLFSRPLSDRAVRLWSELGQCSFGVYLIHHWIVIESEFRLYAPLCNVLPAFPATLVWEIAVFCIALAGAFVIRRIPVLRKLV